MTSVLTVFAALVLDALLGEPRRCHPLVGFGRLAQGLEKRLHRDSTARGVALMLLLLTPFTLLASLIPNLPWSFAFEVVLLYLAIGWNSLGEHAKRVRDALTRNDLPAARRSVALMVSRDTRTLDHSGVANATVESVLENGNDAIFGVIFWYMIAGAPGVVVYRLTNTLDAMWGYRNKRYHRFGWGAARLDDILNFVPARLTALSYALVGRFVAALRCWRLQGATWKSPNAGPVMAAGAGSLGVLLGGCARYDGVVQSRPPLGDGRLPNVNDIDRGLRMIGHALLIWLSVLLVGGWLVQYISRT